MNRIVEWQQSQLERLQVRIRLGHRVDSAECLEGADAVVLASGARPGPVSVEGAEEHGVGLRTAHDVLDSEPVSVVPSLVWDRAGGGAAVSAAEHLARAGCRVVLVTPSMAVADDVDITNRVPLHRRLYEHGVTMLPDAEVARVDAQGVVVTNVYTGGETTIPGIERVVVADAAEACDELADALREEGLRVLTAGDCVFAERGGRRDGGGCARGTGDLKNRRRWFLPGRSSATGKRSARADSLLWRLGIKSRFMSGGSQVTC